MGSIRTLRVCLAVAALALAAEVPAGDESQHWAYRPPRRPGIPAVSALQRLAGPVDCFVLAELERRGMCPSPPADRETLIRRVTFDLTGLPPTPEEIAAFVADDHPAAYERLVDRLLSSPRYGERMAALWLDAARYADTHGYHMDAHRDMWRWRDWVIEAYNENLTFDRFTIEQLAGDLLPNATLAQRVASGFNRNHMINFENGALAEEFLVEYVADRVATTATVWLGQTMVCARCHDHKYDPFTQRDFYGLFAFFHNVPEQGVDGGQGNAAPSLAAPLPQQQAELDELSRRIESATKALAERADSVDADLAEWAATAQPGESRGAATPADFVISFDKADAEQLAVVSGRLIQVPGKVAEGLLFDGQTALAVPAAREFSLPPGATGFTMGLWVYPTTSDSMRAVSLRGDAGWPAFRLWLADGGVKFELAVPNSPTLLELAGAAALALRRWQHVAVRGDLASSPPTLALFIDGQVAESRTTVIEPGLQTDQQESLLIGSPEPGESFRGLLDELKIYRTALSEQDLAILAGGDPVGEILAVPAAARPPDQQAALRRYYLDQVDEFSRQRRRELAQLEQRQRELNAAIPTTMVMEELAERRPTFVLEGGRYNALGEQVEPQVPAILPPLPRGAPADRLTLARWLVDPQHPLTSRVTVNRLWQQFFGAGIVRTPDDFGTRGEPPSHPELLDWLAVEFADDFDVKRLVRAIVTSATYRQSSRVSAELLEQDPENRWLARAPRLRLEAEMIRDNALAVSGLLVEQLGGPSVFPYQPPGLWEEISYDANLFTAQAFVPSHGRDLYRRSLYTFWKRSAPAPNLAAFDLPNRETCSVQRPRSSTPQQALVLMNDVAFVEAARAFALRVLAQQQGREATLAALFQEATGRAPSGTESQELLALFEDLRARFQDDPELAANLARVGETASSHEARPDLAAWTAVANVLLCLDEVITRN